MTEMSRSMVRCWNTTPSWASARLRCLRISVPKMRMLPVRLLYRRVIRLNSVVLPAPFWPSSTVKLPGRIVKLTPSSAVRLPKLCARPSTSRAEHAARLSPRSAMGGPVPPCQVGRPFTTDQAPRRGAGARLHENGVTAEPGGTSQTRSAIAIPLVTAPPVREAELQHRGREHAERVSRGGIDRVEPAEAVVDRGRQRRRVGERCHAADHEPGRLAHQIGIRAQHQTAAAERRPERPRVAAPIPRDQRDHRAPSIVNRSDLTIAPTGTPSERAASSAVRAVVASSITSAREPRSRKAACGAPPGGRAGSRRRDLLIRRRHVVAALHCGPRPDRVVPADHVRVVAQPVVQPVPLPARGPRERRDIRDRIVVAAQNTPPRRGAGPSRRRAAWSR